MTARVVVLAIGMGLAITVTMPSTAVGQAVTSQRTIQAPPRDRQPEAQTGSAVIRGRVAAADSGRPLRRARITLSAPELGRDRRTTSTGLDGRYEITDLPAGRYTIRVQRNGYLALQYGQRRPFEQGKPLQLVDDQVADQIDFSLPRSSVISGRITDELGEPVEGVMVFAMRTTYWQGRRRLVPAGMMARTDDIGAYRLTGLMPGAYLVMASRAVSTSLRQLGSAFTVATPRHRRVASTTDRAVVAAGQRPQAASRPGCRSSVLGHPGGSFSTAD